MMSSPLLKAATKLWRATPFRGLREFYLKMFYAAVRGRERVATIDGLRYHLDLSETIDVAHWLGRFEPEMLAAIARRCRPGMIVLDVGANVGVHTLRFARAVSPGGKVYAFEATDFAFARLQRNVRLNPDLTNIAPIRVALADHNVLAQEINFRASWRTDGRLVSMTSLVDLKRLDDWATDTLVDRIDLLKIDVDGNEYGVLSGGIELLRRSRPLIFTEAGRYHVVEGKNPLRLLHDLGYSFTSMNTGEKYSSIDSLERTLLDLPPSIDSINVLAEPLPS